MQRRPQNARGPRSQQPRQGQGQGQGADRNRTAKPHNPNRNPNQSPNQSPNQNPNPRPPRAQQAKPVATENMSEAARHQMLADERLHAKQLKEKLDLNPNQNRSAPARHHARPQAALFSPKTGGRGR